MNEVYQDLLTPIIYHWAFLQADASVQKGTCSICFCNHHYHAMIYIHKENIVELIIKEKGTDKQVFYLHFQMMDIKTTVENMHSFFAYIKKPHQDTSYHNIQIIHDKDLKILLCCTSGMTTSYFAYLMQTALGCQNKGIEVEATQYSNLDNLQEDYDIILLAPQISYKYLEMREKYGEKVLFIDSMDFATGNVNHVIAEVLSDQ